MVHEVVTTNMLSGTSISESKWIPLADSIPRSLGRESADSGLWWRAEPDAYHTDALTCVSFSVGGTHLVIPSSARGTGTVRLECRCRARNPVLATEKMAQPSVVGAERRHVAKEADNDPIDRIRCRRRPSQIRQTLHQGS